MEIRKLILKERNTMHPMTQKPKNMSSVLIMIDDNTFQIALHQNGRFYDAGIVYSAKDIKGWLYVSELKAILFQAEKPTIVQKVHALQTDGNVQQVGATDKPDDPRARFEYCPECKKKTWQVPTLFNPDNPESGEIWNCTFCKENVEWLDEN